MTASKDLYWEPGPDERQWLKHRLTGQRGYRIVEAGVTKVRLDRSMQRIVLPLDDTWVDDNEVARLTLHQVASIAFAADRKLLAALGQHRDARKEWMELSEGERIAWVDEGPMSEKGRIDPLRQSLWRSIVEPLRPLAK